MLVTQVVKLKGTFMRKSSHHLIALLLFIPLFCNKTFSNELVNDALLKSLEGRNLEASQKLMGLGGRVSSSRIVELIGDAIADGKFDWAQLFIESATPESLDKYKYALLVCTENDDWYNYCSRDHRPSSLLYFAQKNGNQEIVQVLESAGAHLTANEIQENNTDLFYKTLDSKGCKEAHDLVEKGVYPTLPQDMLRDAEKPFDLDKRCGNQLVSKILKMQNYDLNKALNSVLHNYGTQNLEHAKFFIEQGAKHNSENRRQILALLIKNKKETLEAFKEFALSKEDIPEDALLRIIERCQTENALFLIEKGATANSYHLITAIRAELLEVTLALLNAGVQLNADQWFDMFFAKSGREHFFIKLISAGARSSEILIAVSRLPMPLSKKYLTTILSAQHIKLEDLSNDQKAELLVWAINNDTELAQKLMAS